MKKVKYFRKYICIIAIVVGIAFAYKLELPIVIAIGVITTLLMPMLYKEEKKKSYYKKKFEDLISYMEQMCYSFKKSGKIRPSLIDAQKISDGEMKEIIEEVIVNIDSKMNEDIYEQALKILEEEYYCKRLISLHEFIIKIEKQGGEFEEYINIILSDIKEWSDRTELFRRDIDRIRRNVLISIGATLLTCGFMAYLIPKEYSFTGNIVYQISSMIIILIMLVIYIFVYKKLNIDWLKEESFLNPEMVDKYYDLIMKSQNEKIKFMDKLSINKVKKRMRREISKVFPDWLRQVALNLQQQTVQSSIENSYDDAPYILKRPIRHLLIDFEEYPIGIEPYDNFLQELDMPEIQSSLKMFYCINELSKEETYKQTNAIIDRNNKMLKQAEEMKNKDRIGLAGTLSAGPMMVGVVKIIIDMVLMILVFTSALGNVMNGG
ncbi:MULTISPECIES: hypothetical protein [Eubacterium]|jgi:hypothetical protein|uniref:Flp pilus assembly protein TadB n=1 Tax=Eubacterium album TaxID=2978477 RepID=A0ABT2LYL6_9FIRM|nr:MULTISPECIES: hypothetical protein [unclassified Eubacterium (in: firmicutes)]MCT7398374.1 hypothetical protein [Eubacterium sp. LFL-14]RGG62649.1 hypothetical protein DWW96_11765 [Eubacterium sp. AF17-7]RHR35579.1 hypothetical protein DWX29_03240 [Eubacterium sp. AF19-12LB]CDA28605.1 uncharacterized protein BN504_00168 [Eubacterium sp. CAG:156]